LVPLLRDWLPFLPSWIFFLRRYSHQPYIYIYIYIYIYSHHFLPIVPLPVPVKTYHNTLHLPLLPNWLVHLILPIGPHSYINTRSLPPGIFT
jgi:hypothetical protein